MLRQKALPQLANTVYADDRMSPTEAMKFFVLAAFQLQGAATALSLAFNSRGAVQSSLIGTELALKGGLAAFGENKKKRFGAGCRRRQQLELGQFSGGTVLGG